MFESKRVTINEVTSTLLAKGPCRCRVASTGPRFLLGEQSVTALTGFTSDASGASQAELNLGTGERVFGISDTGAGTFDVMVMTYGSP